MGARHDQAATGPAELFGREAEIQQLRQFVSRITQGAGEALLLSGEPDVGKASLLDQAAAIAAGSGIRLLRATGFSTRSPQTRHHLPRGPPRRTRRYASRMKPRSV
ncbi:MAG TPA: ATP-binding protein [Streptosporangiaceae bacterium]